MSNTSDQTTRDVVLQIDTVTALKDLPEGLGFNIYFYGYTEWAGNPPKPFSPHKVGSIPFDRYFWKGDVFGNCWCIALKNLPVNKDGEVAVGYDAKYIKEDHEWNLDNGVSWRIKENETRMVKCENGYFKFYFNQTVLESCHAGDYIESLTKAKYCTRETVVKSSLSPGEIFDVIVSLDINEADPPTKLTTVDWIPLDTTYVDSSPPANVSFFDVNGVNCTMVQWAFTGGDIRDRNVIYILKAPTFPGTYNFTGYLETWNSTTVMGRVCQMGDQSITVIAGPKAVFTESTHTPKVGEQVEFDATSSQPGWNLTDIPITEYRWDFGDGNQITTTTPITYHAYMQIGEYNVTLTVTAPGAAPETDTTWDIKEVVGLPPRSPIGKFTEIPETPYAYQPVYFDAGASQPGFDGDDECPITEYHWNFGDGQTFITTTSTARHVYQNGGNYTVTLTVYAPGIPPYIDPQYVGTNATGTTQEVKYVIPVGGYSVSMDKYPTATPPSAYWVLIIIIAAVLIASRRKIPRKTR